MSVGTGAALAIAAGVSAGTGLISAKMQSNAAKSAAQTQAQSGQQALDLQRQMYQQAQQTYAPYVAMGNDAIGRAQGFLTGPGALGARPVPGAAQFGLSPLGPPPSTLANYAGPGGGMGGGMWGSGALGGSPMPGAAPPGGYGGPMAGVARPRPMPNRVLSNYQ